MTAPERIWAWDDIDTHFRDKSWVQCDAGTGSVEYVRADLHAALQAENERLREALTNPNYEHLAAACDGVNCYPSELAFILEQYYAALK